MRPYRYRRASIPCLGLTSDASSVPLPLCTAIFSLSISAVGCESAQKVAGGTSVAAAAADVTTTWVTRTCGCPAPGTVVPASRVATPGGVSVATTGLGKAGEGSRLAVGNTKAVGSELTPGNEQALARTHTRPRASSVAVCLRILSHSLPAFYEQGC